MVQGVCRYDEVLKYLQSYYAEHGVMPPMKKAGWDLKIQRGSMARVLDGLVRQGYLEACSQMNYRLKS